MGSRWAMLGAQMETIFSFYDDTNSTKNNKAGKHIVMHNWLVEITHKIYTWNPAVYRHEISIKLCYPSRQIRSVDLLLTS